MSLAQARREIGMLRKGVTRKRRAPAGLRGVFVRLTRVFVRSVGLLALYFPRKPMIGKEITDLT